MYELELEEPDEDDPPPDDGLDALELDEPPELGALADGELSRGADEPTVSELAGRSRWPAHAGVTLNASAVAIAPIVSE